VLQFLLERDGLAHWLTQRRRLNDVYWGAAHDSGIERARCRAGRRPRCR
jgi:hypothetical protein